jgi:hypothetical protein
VATTDWRGFAVDALVLDDLQIFGAPGALVTEEHGGLGSTHHGIPPIVLACKAQTPHSVALR